MYDNDDYNEMIKKILENNPELRNFNLDFLKDINPDDLEEIISKLKEASMKFQKAEDKVKQKVNEKLSFEKKELSIDYDNYLKTIMIFPFALAVGEDILEDKSEEGYLKGEFFGKKVNFNYNNIYELISIKKNVAMKIGLLIRKNYPDFLEFREDIMSYLRNTTNKYLESFGFEEDFEIKDIREFNMVVKLKPKNYDSIEQFYENHLDLEKIDKYKILKAYLITEFSIAIID
ncbi:hypothetical protein [Geotoga petraea]|jgi:hypothetical protein|uniref:Uncharacterized protein n=1 Tax=Geotoga petraea TaxID=28234 RepID=A0A1G6MYN5_9BACT|nr:hypothetical protein [Geotoga petraea]MDK2945904.1 hypothetical protein [Geotoga sp.]TGG87296.1 hypothetical protein E4650_08305 [Geotoga petraea]SDC60561.1 hypothetical protein SAMN04488588_1431 [Geotoga petraea]